MKGPVGPGLSAQPETGSLRHWFPMLLLEFHCQISTPFMLASCVTLVMARQQAVAVSFGNLHGINGYFLRTGISDVRDESDRDGMRVVVEVKRGSSPEACSFTPTPHDRALLFQQHVVPPW